MIIVLGTFFFLPSLLPDIIGIAFPIFIYCDPINLSVDIVTFPEP